MPVIDASLLTVLVAELFNLLFLSTGSEEAYI